MPPRGKAEGLVTDIPDQPPSLSDEKVMEHILHLLSEGDESSLTAFVASAVRADRHAVDLRQQILLDARLDFFRFCAAQRYNAAKIVRVLRWLAHFQSRAVEAGRALCDVRAEALAFVSGEVAERSGARAGGAGGAESEAAAEAPPPPPPPPPRAATKKGARAAEKAAQEEAEAALVYPREQTFLSREEIGPFCTYLLNGMIRHAALYAYVATQPRVIKETRTVSYFLELPVPPPPLRSAAPPAPEPMQAVLKNMHEQQADELEMMKGAFEEAATRESIRKTMEQTEKDLQILFKREGTKKAVDDTFLSLENDLSERQRGILMRISALERKLGVESLVRAA